MAQRPHKRNRLTKGVAQQGETHKVPTHSRSPIPTETAPEIEAVTYTCKEAAKRHQGVTAKKFQIMCLQGEWLRSHFRRGGMPTKEMEKALFAKKVGRDWHIPKSELDRMFMTSLT